MAPNGMSTDSMSAGAFIYCGIEPVCVGPGKRYSFPFAGAAAAIAAAIASASATATAIASAAATATASAVVRA